MIELKLKYPENDARRDDSFKSSLADMGGSGFAVSTSDPSNYGYDYQASGMTGAQDLRGTLGPSKWITPKLYYSFPSSASDYGSGYSDYAIYFNLEELTSSQKSVVNYALEKISEFSNLVFSNVSPSSPLKPQLRFAQSDYPDTSYAYYPNNVSTGGDTFYGPSVNDNINPGSYSWHTILHELGHQLGLKHGHESSTFGASTFSRDSQDFSLMTYRNENLGEINGYHMVADGDSALNYRMIDIAALQWMYGANFNHHSENTTYRWTPDSGVMLINGVDEFPFSRIIDDFPFSRINSTISETIWDGGGVDTYDFSLFTEDSNIDLRPGGWSKVSSGQLADFNARTSGRDALGNVYNSYLYNGDKRSLIENVKAGSGSDTIYGNVANNSIDGGAGSDTMVGGVGNDTYYVRDSGDVVTEVSGEGTDTVYSYLGSYTLSTNVENAHIKSTGQANLTGNSRNNVIYAGKGNNVLDGGAGGDTLSYNSGHTAGVKVSLALTTAQTTGGSGTDTIKNFEHLSGTKYADQLTGNSGANKLTGYDGNDTLDGGAGNDTLVGGVGKDVLIGGAGNDIFDFDFLSEMGNTTATCDIIKDFVRGYDKIDLSTLDANTATAVDDAFIGVLIDGNASFTKVGQLKLVGDVLYGNMNNDSQAEFAIQVVGVTALNASDFIL